MVRAVASWRAALAATALGFALPPAAAAGEVRPLTAERDVLRRAPFEVEHDPLEGGPPVFGLAQTPDGFVWLLGAGPPRRYGGRAIAGYPASVVPALVDRLPAFAGVVGRDGGLWLVSGDSLARAVIRAPGAPEPHLPRLPGLVRMYGRRGSVFGVADGLPDAPVTALAVDPRGSLWVTTDVGLFEGRFSEDGAPAGGRAFRSVPLPGWPASAPLGAVTATGEAVWVAAAGRVGRLGVDGSLREVALEGRVTTLVSDKDGGLWIGTLAGLRYAPAAFDGAVRVVDGFGRAPVWALLRDARGRVWVGGERGLAVLRAPDAPPTWIDPAAGMPEDAITALLEDAEGTVWAAHAGGGATRVRDASVWAYARREGLLPPPVRAVLATPDGSVWASAPEGLSRVRGGDVERYRVGVQLPDVEPGALAHGRDGSVYVATRGQGLLRLRDGRLRALRAEDGLVADELALVHVSSDGDLWVGTRAGALVRYRPAPFEAPLGWLRTPVATHPPGAVCRPAPVIAATEGPEGDLWFGTHGAGLVHLPAAGPPRCRDDLAGLAGRPITALAHVDGGLWIGGAEGAAVRVSGDRLEPTSFAPDARRRVVHAFLPDGRGGLWLGASDGVQRPLPGAGPRRWETLIVPTALRERGVVHGHGPGFACDADGGLWFGTERGLLHVPPGPLPPPPEPRPLIDRITLDGHQHPLDSRIETTGQAVEIRFEAPFFVGRPHVFRHRLEGYDRDWQNWGTAAVGKYYGLPPGRYEVRLQVSRPAGGWSPHEARLPLVVAPPFYRSTWFYAGAAVVLALGLGGFHRYRLWRVEAEHRAVQAERLRWARELHDGLGQGFTAAGFHLEALKQSLGPALPEGPATLLGRTKEILTHAHDEARRVIWNLRMEATDRVALDEAVARVVEEQRSSLPAGGPRIAFEAQGHFAGNFGVAAHELPHIAREALTNALRHAHPTNVFVGLSREGRTLRLVVRDDGAGLPAGNAADLSSPGHFGLVGMHERAARMGAHLGIHARPGGGTEVSLELEVT